MHALRESARYPDLPRPAQSAPWDLHLAGVIEAEIIPRLMLAHRADSRAERPGILPNSDQIVDFATLVLSPDCEDVESRIAILVDGGLALDSLLLDLLAPTARHLGHLWEEDLCDFAELTIAMGRLQRIMHDLTARFHSEPAPDPHGRSIFLMACPGETHSFGLSLVERFFRDAGWDVTSTAHSPHSNVLRTASTGWFDVIGVSLGCETLLPTLTRVVTELRRASRNPSVRVMVGGPIFLDNPDHSALVGADATASDARIALTIAESLLDPRARPC
ncbi:cobalamin-dependent protein [Methylobacterium sp. 77]|uniref:cobalamin B12-binding domain-containing protein n=1 Tax=Methylobacterium sp. 77 TaxID=1101192 RepID=UPI001FDA05FD|nr:cobalamin-dependent protein [Methylobacterium sp. 77]